MRHHAILGHQRAMAIINNAHIAVTGAALVGSVERPTCNFFYRHRKQIVNGSRGAGFPQSIFVGGVCDGSRLCAPKNFRIASQLLESCCAVKPSCPPPGMVTSWLATPAFFSASCSRNAWLYGTTLSWSPWMVIT